MKLTSKHNLKELTVVMDDSEAICIHAVLEAYLMTISDRKENKKHIDYVQSLKEQLQKEIYK